MTIKVKIGESELLLCLMEGYSRRIIEEQLSERGRKFDALEHNYGGLRLKKGNTILWIPYHALVFWTVT